MIQIYFVRHGETDWNHLGKHQGFSDIPLNEKGKLWMWVMPYEMFILIELSFQT